MAYESKMIKSRILITGANGFIGSYFFNLLDKRGCEVFGIDKNDTLFLKNKNFFKINILDFSKLQKTVNLIKPNVIVHFAAKTDLGLNDSLENFQDNTLGTENVVKICNEIPSVIKLIFASTILVCPSGYSPLRDDEFNPQTVYGESKVHGENFVREKCLKSWVIVRPTSIWGPSVGSNYFAFFKIISKGLYFNVKGFAPSITFGYLGNFCFQIEQIILNNEINKSVLYLGDYEPTNIKYWSNLISESFNSKKIYSINYKFLYLVAKFGDILQFFGFKFFPLNSYRLNNLINDRIYNLEKTIKILGPNLPYTIKEATVITVNWIKNKNK